MKKSQLEPLEILSQKNKNWFSKGSRRDFLVKFYQNVTNALIKLLLEGNSKILIIDGLNRIFQFFSLEVAKFLRVPVGIFSRNFLRISHIPCN